MSPALTPAQALDNRLAADERNGATIGPHSAPETVAYLLADCAVRWVEARAVDAQVGGREFERRAEANLRGMVKCYAARCP